MTEPVFFTALYALGLVLGHPWTARLGWSARVLLAYPAGMCAWAFTGMFVLGLGIPFNAGVMTVAMVALAGGTLAWLSRRSALDLRLLGRMAATVPAFLLFAWTVAQKNWAEFSFDSHYIVLVGKGLAFDGKIAGRITEQLAEWGVFQLMLHSAAELYGATYFHAASFLVGAHVVALLVWFTARLVGGPQPRLRHVLWGFAAAIAVGSVHFIGFHFFYIHTNFPSALYLLLCAGCGWCYLREEDDAWLPFVFLSAAALALQRTETLLPAVLFLSLLVSELRVVTRAQWMGSLGFAAVAGFWQVTALRHIGEGTTILSPGKVYLLMAMIAGYVGLVALVQFTRAAQLRQWLNLLALLAMSVATLATTLSKPAHMGTSLYSTFANLFLGYWGAAWFLVAACAGIAWALPRLEKGRFVAQGLVCYALLILLLGYMREPYSNRWPDSANRMFVHLFPLAVLYFAVRFGQPLFERWQPSATPSRASLWVDAVAASVQRRAVAALRESRALPRDRVWAAALALSAVFALIHFLALPLLMTFDGSDYVLLGAGWPGNFPTGWHFARAPLYPVALKLGIGVFGPRLGAMAPNVAFALIGIGALSAAIHRTHPRLALAVVALLTLFPTLIVYQHAVLTEAGSFMVLALLANWATWRPADPRLKTGALAVGTVAVLLFRPTSLVLAPLALVFLGVELRRWKHVVAVALVAVVAFAGWNRLSAEGVGQEYAGQNIVYGLLKQVVLPPDDPLLAPVREAYEFAIQSSTVDGTLDPGGLDRQLHLVPFTHLAAHPNPRALLAHAVTTYPGRFLSGVGRGLLLNLGVPSANSENADYARETLTEAGSGTKLTFPAERLAPVFDPAVFVKPRGNGGYGKFIGLFRAPYQLLLWLGALTTLVGFAAGLRLRRADLLMLTAIPLYWAVVNALTLMSSDRFVVPSHAFLVVNAVTVPWMLAIPPASRAAADGAPRS